MPPVSSRDGFVLSPLTKCDPAHSAYPSDVTPRKTKLLVEVDEDLRYAVAFDLMRSRVKRRRLIDRADP